MKTEPKRYVASICWGLDMVRAGHKQEQCSKCKKWVFKSEKIKSPNDATS